MISTMNPKWDAHPSKRLWGGDFVYCWYIYIYTHMYICGVWPHIFSMFGVYNIYIYIYIFFQTCAGNSWNITTFNRDMIYEWNIFQPCTVGTVGTGGIFRLPINWGTAEWGPEGFQQFGGEQMVWANGDSLAISSGNLTVCYWKWPFIADFPIENGDFP